MSGQMFDSLLIWSAGWSLEFIDKAIDEKDKKKIELSYWWKQLVLPLLVCNNHPFQSVELLCLLFFLWVYRLFVYGF